MALEISPVDQVWFRPSSGKKIDDFRAEVLRAMEGTDHAEIEIGTDAQYSHPFLAYVTVIAVHRFVGGQGKGVIGLATKYKEARPPSLRQKLWEETMRSLMVAMDLEQHVPDRKIIVHVDASMNPAFKSSKYCKELVGMVVGQGFEAKIKPDAWLASHGADHIVKNKHLKARGY
jgi:predicted RNase H-related nuclease YkuK (DUF458 family)